MKSPHLEVLGVYKPQISKKAWREQWNVTGDDKQTRLHFEKLVLIEAVVGGLTEPFKMEEFGQMQPDGPIYRSHMQVGYDEGLLSADGDLLIQRKMGCVYGTGALRFAVYLHLYDPDRPLQWEHGELICPPVQEAPKRLMKIVPYRACT
jgi:hypothetical protein